MHYASVDAGMVVSRLFQIPAAPTTRSNLALSANGPGGTDLGQRKPRSGEVTQKFSSEPTRGMIMVIKFILLHDGWFDVAGAAQPAAASKLSEA
jgi:hypothetical protein